MPGTVVDIAQSAVNIAKSLPSWSLCSSGVRPTMKIILSMRGIPCHKTSAQRGSEWLRSDHLNGMVREGAFLMTCDLWVELEMEISGGRALIVECDMFGTRLLFHEGSGPGLLSSPLLNPWSFCQCLQNSAYSLPLLTGWKNRNHIFLGLLYHV